MKQTFLSSLFVIPRPRKSARGRFVRASKLESSFIKIVTPEEMSDKKKIGPLGEELVVKFLVKRGYEILDRNYRRPWGELDIVAQRKNKIHFVEVKALSAVVGIGTVTHETSLEQSEREKALVYIRSKYRKDRFRPEDHMSRNKTLRLSRIIQTYLMGKHVSSETSWQFDVATVLIDGEKKVARINLLEDIILEQRRR